MLISISTAKRVTVRSILDYMYLKDISSSAQLLICRQYSKEILTAMRVMVVSIGSRGSHIPAMTPRRLRPGVIAGM